MNWYEDKIKRHPQYASAKLVADLDVLYPPFALCIFKIFAIARKEGLSICIYETYRSQERQTELFEKGVTKLKTNGMHHFGVAADIIFLDDKNNPSWSEECNWKRLGEIGKGMGLIWGGDWPWDKPHFQLIPATVIDQAKIIKGEYPSYDLSIDQCVADLFIIYKDSQANKFSDASILEMISYIENIGKEKSEPNVKSPSSIIDVVSQSLVVKQIPVEVKIDSRKSLFDFIGSILKDLFKIKD